MKREESVYVRRDESKKKKIEHIHERWIVNFD